jgi:3-hydroxyisobutyrate dehydrogenase-like beta-hydroxyacid dehydrogenase
MNLVLKNIFSFSKISFIGLGNMGFPMAINLSKKGHEVFAYDIDATK